MQFRIYNGPSRVKNAGILLLLLAAACVGFCALMSACSDTSNAEGPGDNFRVGVLLDVNNQVYPIGGISVTALQLAAEDFNRYLKDNGHTKQIELVVEDTQGDPAIAEEKMQAFAWAGIVPVFTGTSAEVEAVAPIAQQHNQIVISSYSTATSLAGKDDQLFRFCMNDIKQGKGLVRLVLESGLKSVVLVYRDDVYGNDLKNYILQSAEQYGLDIDQEAVYNPDETDYSSLANSIAAKVAQEKSENPPGTVAVLLIALNEVTRIFQAANGNVELESVPWIGAIGVEPDAIPFEESGTVAFAEKVGYTVCDFSVDLTQISDPFQQVPTELQEKSGLARIPSTAYYYYDAMWVLAEAWFSMGRMDAGLLKKNIFFKAATNRLCTDEIAMDEFGDRKFGNYGFWRLHDGSFEKVAVMLFGSWAPNGHFEWLTGNGQ
jgi:branched-chain amino acid transport system substrate-binding protein